MNEKKPRIYSNCKSGCLWETVHKSDFEKSASHILQYPIQENLYYLKIGKEYKVFTPKKANGTEYDCYMRVYVDFTNESGVPVNVNFSLPIPCNDKYSENFVFKIVAIDSNSANEDGSVKVIYELDGIRYEREIVSLNFPLDFLTASSFSAHAEIATNGTVMLFNSDATVLGAKGDSVFVRYSANADGTDFTETWTAGQKYIGVATAQYAPTNKNDYTWVLFAGADESSGGGVVVVKTEYNPLTSQYFLTMSVAEIYEVYQQGKIVMINNGGDIYQLAYIDAGSMCFSYIYQENDRFVYCSTFSIYHDSGVDYVDKYQFDLDLDKLNGNNGNSNFEVVQLENDSIGMYASKNYNEIKALAEAGKFVVCSYRGYAWYTLATIDGNDEYAYFCKPRYYDEKMDWLYITTSGRVTMFEK